MKLSNWLARDGVERPLIWPCVTLALLCALNLWVNPHFLSLRMLDGHLFGAPMPAEHVSELFERGGASDATCYRSASWPLSSAFAG